MDESLPTLVPMPCPARPGLAASRRGGVDQEPVGLYEDPTMRAEAYRLVHKKNSKSDWSSGSKRPHLSYHGTVQTERCHVSRQAPASNPENVECFCGAALETCPRLMCALPRQGCPDRLSSLSAPTGLTVRGRSLRTKEGTRMRQCLSTGRV